MDAELFQLVTEFEVWRVRLARLAKRKRVQSPTNYFFGGVRDSSDKLARELLALEQAEETNGG